MKRVLCTVLALSDVATAELSAYYEAKGKEGFRVLGLATRAVSAKGAYQRDDEAEMVFAGFLLFLDPPKADAARVLGDLATLNVEVHGSRGRAAASEVRAALTRINALDETWSCPECRTRVWHRGTPDAARCKCGRTSFPPVRAS